METQLLAQAETELETEFEGPTIADFVMEPFAFQGTIFEMNRFEIIRLVAILILFLFFGLAAKNAKVVPGRLQVMAEFVINFVDKQIVSMIMNKSHARKWLPFAVTIFCTIAVMNLMGLVPGLDMAGTSAIGLPIVLALWVVYQYWSAGIKQHGFLGFLKEELTPQGVPPALWILMIPLELLQLLITRPFSLAIRLFANMVSGHMLLAVCYLGTQFLVVNSDGIMKFLGIFTYFGVLFFTAFELFVAILQAYIFTLLAISYIEMSYPPVDHSEPATAESVAEENNTSGAIETT